MSDGQPPRKQLRLIIRGKEKIQSLLNARVQETERSSSIENILQIQGNVPNTSSSTRNLAPAITSQFSHNQKPQSSNIAPNSFQKASLQTSFTSQSQTSNKVEKGKDTSHSEMQFKAWRRQGSVGKFLISGMEPHNQQKQHKTKGLDITSSGLFQITTRVNKRDASSGSGFLDHLKRRAIPETQGSKFHGSAPISNISAYIQPKVTKPKTAPELIRCSALVSQIPRLVHEKTLPVHREAVAFIRDAETNEAVPASGIKTRLIDPTRVPVQPLPRHPPSSDFSSTDITMSDASPDVACVSHRAQSNKQKNAIIVLDNSGGAAPENYYTGTLRLVDAYNTAKCLRKRKRTSDALPAPTSYFYEHTGDPNFNLFSNGFLLYPELCLLLAAQLPVQTLINLYSISKDFHVIVNQRFTTVILNQVSLKAPNAARCYPWRCFKHLCQPDPSVVGQHTYPGGPKRAGGVVVNIPKVPASCVPDLESFLPRIPNHRVPTFRWLRFAIHREKVIHALYHAFAFRGVPLPGAPTDTVLDSFCVSLHKLWFLFDIPDNPRRFEFVHSTTLMTDGDITNILTLVVKLDMICNDPMSPEKRDCVRKMMMSSSDGFDTILKVVRREIWTNEFDVLRAWTQLSLELTGQHGMNTVIGTQEVSLGLSSEAMAASTSIFGVPKAEVGLQKINFWGILEPDLTNNQKGPATSETRRSKDSYTAMKYLIRPDQLVLRESVRRGHVFEKQFVRMLLYGYVNEGTLEATLPQDLNGGRSTVLEVEGEYEIDDNIAGCKALTASEGGDDLLDLGDLKRGSEVTLLQRGPTEQVRRHRVEEDTRLEGFMAAWRAEANERQAVVL